jgi:hypothetical protein
VGRGEKNGSEKRKKKKHTRAIVCDPIEDFKVFKIDH